MSLSFCVSALMGKGKENGKLEGQGKVFLPFNSPECLEWLYSLHQIAVCIYQIYFLFKSVYFWGKTFLSFFLSFWEWVFWDDGPYCLWSSGLTGGTGLEDHGQCAGLYVFSLFAFIYWYIYCAVIWYGIRNLTRLTQRKGEETEWETKVHKIIVV